MKKTTIFLIMITVTIALLISIPADAKQINVQLSWVKDISYIHFILAQKKGFYSKQGLDINLTPGRGSNLTLKLLARDKAQIGIASASSTLVAQTKGMPIKIVAAIYQNSPACFFFIQGVIKDIRDLEGKTIASNPKSPKHLLFQVLLAKNGIDPQRVKMVPSPPGGELKLFIAGRTDGALYYAYDGKPFLEKNNIKFDYFMFSNQGINIFDQAIIVNEQFFKENPDLVKRFVEATIEGIKYTLAHPEKAVEALLEISPNLNKGEQLAQLKNIIPLYGPNDKIGYMNPAKWMETRDTLAQAGLIPQDTEPATAYINIIQAE